MLLSINERIIDKPATLAGLSSHKGWRPFDFSSEQLEESIKRGFAFSAQFADGKRSKECFEASGFLAIDIDGGINLEAALGNPYVVDFASLLYTTPSHTDRAHRFRIVFELESPVTVAQDHEAALSALIQILGGDPACNDAARIFYGFSGAAAWQMGKRITDKEFATLVEGGRKLAGSKLQTSIYSEGELATGNSSHSRTVVEFGDAYRVRLADGTSNLLRDLSAKTLIHCPFHNDKAPSAFVFVTKRDLRGIYCHSCGVSYMPDTEKYVVDFQWYRSICRETNQHYDLDNSFDFDPRNPPVFAYSDRVSVQLFDHQFLPEVPNRPDITLVRSPKGTGKTECLKTLVAEIKASGSRILLVGHRQLLIRSLAERLNLPCYLDSKDFEKQFEKTGCAAISLDSLGKLSGAALRKFDAIIIDESEQVSAHILSETLKGNRRSVFMALAFYMRQAKQIVCLDADVGLLTQGLLTFCKVEQRHLHYVFNSFRLARPEALLGKVAKMIASVSDRPNGFTPPAADALSNEKVFLYSTKAPLLSELMNQIAEGKRCFVATNSMRIANAIDDMVSTEQSDRRRLLITSETSRRKEVVAFINNPAKLALSYDVVIYSPALATGVDITFSEGKREVDAVFGIFEAAITTHFEIDQQLSRVRSPREMHVYVSNRRLPLETDPGLIRLEIENSRLIAEAFLDFSEDGRWDWDSDLLDLCSWILAVRRASLSDLRRHFVQLRQDNGWDVTEVLDGAHHESKSLRFRRSNGIARLHEAKPISTIEYQRLIKIGKQIGFEPAEQASIQRYEIELFYGRPVTEELVSLDDRGRLRPKLYLLKYMLSDPAELKEEDLADIRRGIASFDRENRAEKKCLLVNLLEASGVYKDRIGFDPSVVIETSALGGLRELSMLRKDDLERLLKICVRADVIEKPMLLLQAILKSIGMEVSKAGSKRAAGKKVYLYTIDSDRLAVVTSLASSLSIKS